MKKIHPRQQKKQTKKPIICKDGGEKDHDSFRNCKLCRIYEGQDTCGGVVGNEAVKIVRS